MSVTDPRIFTKKTSKHPKESNESEFYEKVTLKEEQNVNKHVDIFSMPNIFLNEQKSHMTPQKHPLQSAKHPITPQKQPNSITEMKKIIDRKRKKRNRPKLQQKELSLIQQSQSEYNNTSSQNDSILNESSIENVETSSVSFSEKSFSDQDNKMNEGFIGEQSSQDDVNKTVVMSKRKTPQKHKSPQKSQELAENELEQLQLFAKKYSVDALHRLYREGNLSEMKFLLVLELKKEHEKARKEDKFNQNLAQIQNVANIIDENYQLLHQKLQKDSINDSKKLRIFTQNIIKIHNENTPKPFNLPNPSASKLQLQALQVMAQQKAKKEFLTILQDMHQTFQSQYNKCIRKIEFEKNAQENFSDNLIFTEMKQLIKTNKQIYLFFERSLINDERSEKSLISLHARKHYLELLTEKFQRQVVKIEEFKTENLKNQAIKLLQQQNATEISEELSIKLFESVEKRLTEKLRKIKQHFLQHIVWLRIIREKGELNQGKIFRQAVWIMSKNQPLNVPISNLKQKFLLQNYKFYRKNVSKKISAQFATIKQLFQSSNKKRQVQKENVKKRKKQHFENCLSNLEKKVECLQIHAQKNGILNVFKRGNLLRSKEINQSEDYFQILQSSLERMKDLEQKTNQLLLVSVNHKKFQQKKLIPPKRVVRYDFRTKQTGDFTGHCSTQKLPTQKKNKLMDRLESKYRLEHSSNDLKVEVEKGRLPLEKHNLHIKDQMLQMQKLRNIKQESEETYTEEQRKQYFDRVYELISKKQILSSSHEEQKEQQETYCTPTSSEMQWSYMSKIRFAHQRQKHKRNSSYYRQTPSQNSIIQSPSFAVTNNSYQSSDLKTNLSAFQIQEACRIFTREFYFNSNLTSQLQLNEKQLCFLMSPEYRRNYLEKKLKDQYLEERIINIIRNNPLQMIEQGQQHPSSHYNPINHMIQIDPEFQQRIQEYQDKIVKSLHLSLHPDHISQYQNDNWLCEEKSRSYSLFDQSEDQSLHYWTQNNIGF